MAGGVVPNRLSQFLTTMMLWPLITPAKTRATANPRSRRRSVSSRAPSMTAIRFRCELRSRHPDRVEFHADQLAQSVQRAPAPGRSDRFVRALVSPVSALLRARRRADGRTWCRGGCQLHLALGAGLCTRTEQTLPTVSQADEQELSDRRDLY